MYFEFLKNLDLVFEVSKDHEDLYVIPLWSWTKENNTQMRKLIVSMKDGANKKLYELFVKWMRLKLQYHEISFHHNFVPIPSRDRKHPQCLAKVYAVEFAGKDLNLLKKTKKQTQKKLNKESRKKLRFECEKPMNFNQTYKKPIVLLDDVIVTGASIREAIKKLKDPQVEYIAVWAEKNY